MSWFKLNLRNLIEYVRTIYNCQLIHAMSSRNKINTKCLIYICLQLHKWVFRRKIFFQDVQTLLLEKHAKEQIFKGFYISIKCIDLSTSFTFHVSNVCYNHIYSNVFCKWSVYYSLIFSYREINYEEENAYRQVDDF